MKQKFLFYLLLPLGLCSFSKGTAQNAVWQWKTEVRNFARQPKHAVSEAFLWIPEKARKVKGIIIAQHNMEEISILEDTQFREEMAALGFAEIWCAPMFDHTFDFTDGALETLEGILADLADSSGYQELKHVPLIAIGHSAAASWPYYLGAVLPDRTLVCVSVSGQWPYFRDKSFARDIWGDRNIDCIPCLETMGEYEAAHTWSREGLKERKEHPALPLSMLACPAEGHFAYTPGKAAYIAMFIRKAVKYGHVDPRKQGWLAEKWNKDTKPGYEPAPVKEYAGNPDQAFWFFDREMAEATAAYQSRYRGMKAQLVGVQQNGEVVRQRNTHLQVHPRFLPEEDGITFRLTPVFLDTVPGESPRCQGWTGLPVGASIGHARSGMPVTVRKICGPFTVTAEGHFKVQWDRATSFKADRHDLTFVIEHPGDGTYKPAAQQAQVTIPGRNGKGQEQRITFANLPDVQKGTSMVKLLATADSGLPVGFFVKNGPARIEGNTLKITAIPPRAKLPVAVTVVAWQYGNTQFKTAEPVVRTFYVTDK